jgi:hypothetical protein
MRLRSQEWFNLATDDVLCFRMTPRRVTFSSLAGCCPLYWKKNPMGTAESIHTGRQVAVRSAAGHAASLKEPNFRPMSPDRRVLRPLSTTAEITSTAWKSKTVWVVVWLSTLEDLLPGFRGVFAQSLKQCKSVNSLHPDTRVPSIRTVFFSYLLNFFTNCCQNKHFHNRTVRHPCT